MGTSLLLKANVDRVLSAINFEAHVVAASLNSLAEHSDSQIVLTTRQIEPELTGLNAEIIVIDKIFDLAEIESKLTAALL
jgi:galactitol-specific phosphotransferase system IIB component